MRWVVGVTELLLLLLLCSVARVQGGDAEAPGRVIILVGTVDGRLHAFNEDMEQIWSTSSGKPLLSTSRPKNPKSSFVVPTIDGQVLISDSDGYKRTSLRTQWLTKKAPFRTRDGLQFTGKENKYILGLNMDDGTFVEDQLVANEKQTKVPVVDRVRRNSPLWIGRTDYSIKAVNEQSREQEYAFSFSEFKPIVKGGVNALPEEEQHHGLALVSHHGRPHSAGSPKAGDLRPWTSIVSTPEGYLYFMDPSGEPLHAVPIHLKSPVAHAFLVNIENDSPVMEAVLSVSYTLADLRWRNRIREESAPKPVDKSLALAEPSPGKSMVLVGEASCGLSEVPGFPFALEVSIGSSELFSNLVGIADIDTAAILPREMVGKPKTSALALTLPSANALTLSGTSGMKAKVNSLSSALSEGPAEAPGGRYQMIDATPDTEPWLPPPVTASALASHTPRTRSPGSGRGGVTFLATVLALILALFTLSRLRPQWLAYWRSGPMTLITPLVAVEEPQLVPVLQEQDGVPNSQLDEQQVETSNPVRRVGAITVFESEVLGYGSHGTVVFRGALNDRPIAVKRMLAQFTKAAEREMSLLIRSDGHPNVVRYFLNEQHQDFVYLSLQLCEMSLRDFVMQSRRTDLEFVSDVVRLSLLQIMEGLAHLHSLRIVHRDIKPHNILLARPVDLDCERRQRADRLPSRGDDSLEALGGYVLKISDMGLARQLHRGEASFSATSLATMRGMEPPPNHGAADGAVGTIGWQAPELVAASMQDSCAGATPSLESLVQLSEEPVGEPQRRTLAVDVFSLGCVIHYVLSGGLHPFGEYYERVANILANKPNLSRLAGFPDAAHLVESMLQANPAARPTSAQVCEHPFFWGSTRRLEFVLELSDRLEKETADSALALAVEVGAQAVLGGSWDRRLEPALLDDLGKFRKYDFSSVRDLLRIIRNKRHHYYDLSADLQRAMGSLPEGFWAYFDRRFPRLVLHCWVALRALLRREPTFGNWASATAVTISPPAAAVCSSALPPPPPQPSIVNEVVVWQGSPLHSSLRGNGWWRDVEHWSSDVGTARKSRAKVVADPKFRTRLCSHWEASGGANCPMRKKGKCVFAHGPQELRTRESRRERWGRGAPAAVQSLTASAGEDAVSAARFAAASPPRAAFGAAASPAMYSGAYAAPGDSGAAYYYYEA